MLTGHLLFYYFNVRLSLSKPHLVTLRQAQGDMYLLQI
jgi:hypothetical protein